MKYFRTLAGWIS